MQKFAKIFFLTLLLVVSCSPKITKLEIVRIGNLRLDSVHPTILSFRAELSVRNPYSVSARLKDISFDLALSDDHYIAYGKLPGPVELGSKAIQTIDVPLAVHCKQVTEKDVSMLFSDRIPYRLNGSAILEKPFGPRKVPIEIRSTVETPGELKVYLKDRSSLSIVSLDASTTQQLLSLLKKKQLQLRFDNPFAFPLNVQDFRYEIRLGTDHIARGTAETNLNLKPGKNKFIVLVDPSFRGAAEGILKGLLTKSIPDLTIASSFSLVRDQRGLQVQLIYSPEDR